VSDLQAELDRGIKAERLLKDPTLNEAFDLVAKAIHERWEQCPIRDRDGAHELKLQLKLLGDVRANLEQAVSDGKLAAMELRAQTHREFTPAEFTAAYR
jgi:hypothetical protein